MGDVNCLYCGGKVADDLAQCPHCGAVSHFQQKGYRSGVKQRFILWFLVLAAFSFIAAFWLPR